MSELLGLAFLFVARARDKGLTDEETLWLAEQQLEHLDCIDFLKRLDKEEFA
jgi:hypothetical protein